jgi:hypothetical protein
VIGFDDCFLPDGPTVSGLIKHLKNWRCFLPKRTSQQLAMFSELNFLKSGGMVISGFTSIGQMVMRNEIDIPIDAKTRAALDKAGNVTLNDKQLEDLKQEIEEYALLRESEFAIRTSASTNRRRDKIKKHIAKLIDSFGDLRLKLSSATTAFDATTAMNDEIMFFFADVDDQKFLGDLVRLNDYLAEKRDRRAAGGRPRDLWLGEFLENLASLYLESGGLSTAVSKDDANDRESAFLDFVWVAMQLLPRPCRPQSKEALAANWEKRRRAKSP